MVVILCCERGFGSHGWELWVFLKLVLSLFEFWPGVASLTLGPGFEDFPFGLREDVWTGCLGGKPMLWLDGGWGTRVTTFGKRFSVIGGICSDPGAVVIDFAVGGKPIIWLDGG